MIDYFGVEANELKQKKLWLFGMDGTICKDDRIFPGTLELLNWIINCGGHYVFITNNSSKSVADYISKVNDWGIKANALNFFTSTQATILWLKQNMPNARVYCQGTRSFVEELTKAKINITTSVEKVDVVLVGFDTELSSIKIRNTCEILTTQEVKYIATNPDLVCPVSFGFIPDCGAICEMLKHATGKWPMFIGKPESTMVDIVRKKFNYSAHETCVIGDRLYTDIAAGINAGVSTICVLTGEACAIEIQNGNIRPMYTFDTVLEISNSVNESN